MGAYVEVCGRFLQDHRRGYWNHGHVARAGPHRQRAAPEALPSSPLALSIGVERAAARPHNVVQGATQLGMTEFISSSRCDS